MSPYGFDPHPVEAREREYRNFKMTTVRHHAPIVDVVLYAFLMTMLVLGLIGFAATLFMNCSSVLGDPPAPLTNTVHVTRGAGGGTSWR